MSMAFPEIFFRNVLKQPMVQTHPHGERQAASRGQSNEAGGELRGLLSADYRTKS